MRTSPKRKREVSGTICLPSDELSRYPDFTAAAVRMALYTGRELGIEIDVLPVKGKNIVEGLNNMAREFRGDWMVVLDDDHDFPRDMLVHLLRHEVDIVAPLNIQRYAPFAPVIFSGDRRLSWKDLKGASGLVNAAPDTTPLVTGKAGMVIKRRVLDALGDEPFVALKTDLYASSDLVFCQRAIDAGFMVHIDLDVVQGHIGTAKWTPARCEDGSWGVFCEVAGKPVMMITDDNVYKFAS